MSIHAWTHYRRTDARCQSVPTMLKKLFLASASVLMLSLAYHLGAGTATAQGGSSTVVGFASSSSPNTWYILLSNGDIWYRSAYADAPEKVTNFWGATTPVSTQSWGAVKAKALK